MVKTDDQSHIITQSRGNGVGGTTGIGFKKFMELLIDEINKHKWIRSRDEGRDLGHAAVQEWINLHALEFRKFVEQEYGPIRFSMEFKRFMDMQAEEIMKDKWIQSQAAGRDLGAEAVHDWIRNHAAEFRAHIEETHGPILHANAGMSVESVLEWIRIYHEKFQHCVEGEIYPEPAAA